MSLVKLNREEVGSDFGWGKYVFEKGIENVKIVWLAIREWDLRVLIRDAKWSNTFILSMT